VLSTAVAKEIDKNIRGLKNAPVCGEHANEVLEMGSYKKIASTKYVNDKQITDHYAIIPTGQGFGAWNSLSQTSKKVYEIIVRRFLAIFYPPAVYQKLTLTISMMPSGDNRKEYFCANFKVLGDEGYQKIMKYSFADSTNKTSGEESDNEVKCDPEFLKKLSGLKKGTAIHCMSLALKEGETSPPKRYNSGSMILAMENAGQLIEDDDLRAQIKGSGIGTSATRAGILTKLFHIKYLALNKKTQIITPTLQGELIYDVVYHSIASLLDPKLTASWEKGLTGVAGGTISREEYTEKMDGFVIRHTNRVKELNNQWALRGCFDKAAQYYKK
ncbi:MAG: type IA DNA topoisomerase, partial [Lachnospiraceae bacterium]|nr:type IA DNA topoisomerase [Lachnospiraceae bacterium]